MCICAYVHVYNVWFIILCFCLNIFGFFKYFINIAYHTLHTFVFVYMYIYIYIYIYIHICLKEYVEY